MATGRLEEIEEERRLFYVALTRAKDWLYVCYPLRYYSYPRTFSDVHGYAQLTRFLSEGVRPLFEEIQAISVTSPDDPADPASRSTGGSGPRVTTEDIRRRLKGMF
jgi:DNA helicase-2/ATP-dependent DNA helicase PcrA